MSEDFFWEIIKQSGKNCDNINNLRNKMKKKSYSKIKELDSIFNKYYTLIWIKFEPLLKDFYDEDSSGFNDFVFYLLSEGKDKLTAFLNTDSNSNYFKDYAKFNVEYKIEETLFKKQSLFQFIKIFKTKNFGNMLVIDNDVQLTESDEKNYHEMITHVGINYFNDLSIRVLIIGGGDGGALREVLKHNNVSEAYIIDIDQVVIDASVKYLPGISNGAFTNPKTKVIIQDGYKWVEDYKGPNFDFTIVDSTDFNQSFALFSTEFFLNLKKILNPKSLICFNADNINWNEQNIIDMVDKMKKIFKYVAPYTVYIPTYAGGFYSFCLVSDTINPLNFNIDWVIFENKKLKLDYYNEEIHMSSFKLPNKLKLKLEAKEKTTNMGVHYLLDIESLNFDKLNDKNFIDKICKEAIKIGKMTLLDHKLHQFNPQGVTGIYLLAESHLSFHSWPEKGSISIDFYTCGNFDKAYESVQYIIKSFNSTNYKLKKVIR
jgi:spermidine synthase